MDCADEGFEVILCTEMLVESVNILRPVSERNMSTLYFYALMEMTHPWNPAPYDEFSMFWTTGEIQMASKPMFWM